MYIYIIVAVIIALILTTVLFFALRSTVKRIDFNTRRYFVDKLQDYDSLIDEKKKILDELNQEIEKNKKVLSEEPKIEKKDTSDGKLAYYDNSKLPKYTDENIFKKYKDIKTKFSFDKEKIVNNFISNLETDNTPEYTKLVELRKKFNNDVIYKIIKLRNKNQIEYLHKILTDEEIKTVKNIVSFEKFKINRLLSKLDMLIEKNDPIVYIYTGETNESFDHIDSSIQTQYDSDINEGIKIRYKGILYDYSL